MPAVIGAHCHLLARCFDLRLSGQGVSSSLARLGFQGAAGIAMVTLSTAYGLSKGLAMGSAVVILTAFNITNGGSRIIMGFLSDVIGRKLAMSLTFLSAGGAYFLLPMRTP